MQRGLLLSVVLSLLFVQLRCGDGDSTRPTVVADAQVQLSLVADDFATPLWGVSPPGVVDQLFVIDQVGTVTTLDIATTSAQAPSRSIVLDVGPTGHDMLVPLPLDSGFDERGLLGFAFHPNYAENGLFYTYTSEPLGSEPHFTTLDAGTPRDPEASLSVVREWQAAEPAAADPQIQADSRVLLRIEQPQANHNAGALAFGPDELLYIALGDGGSRDDQGVGHAPTGNAQDLSDGNLLGKILRIDPFGDNGVGGEYGVPAGNPFVGAAGADEIFASGFRNPFRMSFDSVTGELYVADVGQADIEEVDIVVSGGNYGWPIKEGSFLFDANGRGRGFATVDSPGEPAGLIDPVAQYDHDQGLSVTGGFVYRGNALPELRGNYVFGDLTVDMNQPLGRLYALDRSGVVSELLPTNAVDHRLYITGFGQDAAGELYVMGLSRRETGGVTGVVLMLQAAP